MADLGLDGAWDRARFVGITAGGLALLWALTWVRLPGLDPEMLAVLGAPREPLSLGAAGVTPLVSASLLLGLLSWLFAGLRGWRAAGPGDAAAWWRRVSRLAVGLAGLQGFQISVQVELAGTFERSLALSPGWLSRALITLSLMAVTALIAGWAEWVARRGVGNLLVLGSQLAVVGAALAQLDPLAAEDRVLLLPMAAACGAVVLGARHVLRPGARVGAAWLGVGVALALGQLTAAWGAFFADSAPPWAGWPAALTGLGGPLVAAVAAFGFTAVVTGESVAVATRAAGLAAGLLLFRALLDAWGMAPIALDLTALVPLCAAALDLADEWRARRAEDVVVVWTVHRPWELDPLLARLEAADLRAFARGRRFASLLSVFNTWSPIEILVPRAQAAAAAAALAGEASGGTG